MIQGGWNIREYRQDNEPVIMDWSLSGNDKEEVGLYDWDDYDILWKKSIINLLFVIYCAMFFASIFWTKL